MTIKAINTMRPKKGSNQIQYFNLVPCLVYWPPQMEGAKHCVGIGWLSYALYLSWGGA